MPGRRGLLSPQNPFLDTIATRFDGTHSNFVLGNAQVPNLYPIVYCSDGFCELTGHPRAQIMQKGCACSFLYGPETTEEDKKRIESALESKSELKLEVTLYRSNGTPFQCLLDIVPIRNEKHEVVFFLASHKDVSKCDPDNESEDEDSGENAQSTPGTGDSSNNPYQRRRSRAVLYQLSGHYRRTDNVKSKLNLNNNLLHASALPEYTAATLKKPHFILSHYGAFKTAFDWLILIATFYVAIAVPFSATFRDAQNKEPIRTIYLDVFVEVIFIIDIILTFRTTYVNKKGEVVTDTKSIVMHYLKGWFVCDLLAALPFDVLYAANLYSRNTLIHLLKLTRLLRLVRLFAKMDRYSQYSYIILTLLMLMFALVSHWLACIWFVIAVEEIERNPQDWDVSWLRQLSSRLGYDVVNQTDITSSYLTALYFTTSSLTSVGFGNVAANTNAEKVFSVFIMLIGALMHAVVFGNVTAIIQRMYARRSQYQTKLRDLKDFFRLHHIPKRLRQRMIEYFQTSWSLNHGIDTNEVLSEFPDELRGDVSLHLHREILSLPIFETASPGFLKLMSRSVKSNFCAPGEYLVHTGDAISHLYLVCNGSMEVLQNGSMVVAILGKGDLVGYDIPFSLLSETLIKSSSDVKAITYCDLKSIAVPGLLEVLRMYPEFAETFCTEIVHDLTFNLREGFQNDVDMMPHGAHSLTLPSISEEEDEDDDDDDADNDDNDDSGSGSPPSSPLVAPSASGRRGAAGLTLRRKSILTGDGAPLIPRPRLKLRFAQKTKDNSSSLHSRMHTSAEKSDLRVEVELTRNCVDRLDSQMSQMRQDIGSLSNDLQDLKSMLQQLCVHGLQSRSQQQQLNKSVSYQEISGAGQAVAGSPLLVSESSLKKCSSQSLTNSSSFSQIVSSHPVSKPSSLKPSNQTRGSQTARSMRNELLHKISDSGSPPPNSGYSSSSSNEERVKFLIGIQSQRNAEDSESASDDSVLRASNSLTIQSMSSRDVSPFKGTRNSWSTVQSLADTTSSSVSSPLNSPKPPLPQSGHLHLVHRLTRAQTESTSSSPQCAIDIDASATSTHSSDRQASSQNLRKLC